MVDLESHPKALRSEPRDCKFLRMTCLVLLSIEAFLLRATSLDLKIYLFMNKQLWKKNRKKTHMFKALCLNVARTTEALKSKALRCGLLLVDPMALEYKQSCTCSRRKPSFPKESHTASQSDYISKLDPFQDCFSFRLW